jgi:hypothetical protein
VNLPFTSKERLLIEKLRTPNQVQCFLNKLSYNIDRPGEGKTLRSFRGVLRYSTVHCMEAALAAAVILEQHGFPPLVLSIESIDYLDHVMFVYQRGKKWGSVARSRDLGLHGRKAAFSNPHDLVLSYVEPYVDFTGRILGYAVVDLRELGTYDWRLSKRNVWKAERLLQDYPHRPIHTSDQRIEKLRKRFRLFKSRYPEQRPNYFKGQERWTQLPEH